MSHKSDVVHITLSQTIQYVEFWDLGTECFTYHIVTDYSVC